MKPEKLGVAVAATVVALSVQPARALAQTQDVGTKAVVAVQTSETEKVVEVGAEGQDASVAGVASTDEVLSKQSAEGESSAAKDDAGKKNDAAEEGTGEKDGKQEVDPNKDPEQPGDPDNPSNPDNPDEPSEPDEPAIEKDSVISISSELTKGSTNTRVATAGDSGNAGTNVQADGAINVLGQHWSFEYLGNDEYRFISLKSRNALGYAAAKKEANVLLMAADKENTRWKLFKNEDGSFSFAPSSNEKLRLDLAWGSKNSGTNLWLYESNGTQAQKFFLTVNPVLTEALRNGKTADEGVYTIKSDLGNVSVDISSASRDNGANGQIWNSNKTLAQKYVVAYAGNGLYTLQTGNAAKYLDVANGGTTSGTNVQQFEGNGTLSQLWYFIKSASTYIIRSAQNGLALDVSGASNQSGTNVQVWENNGTRAQKFALEKAQLVENGVYALQSGVYFPVVLDVSNGSHNNGANVQTWYSNGTDAQRFRVTLNDDGTYSIINVASGKALDITWGDKSVGANVWMYENNHTAAQKWNILPGSAGLIIRSALSDNVLDVSNGSRARGANVQVWANNGTAAQMWNFKDASWEYYQGVDKLRDKIIDIVRSQVGVRYWSMHAGPKGSGSEGWGCAMLMAYAYNQVFGTNWFGSCYNLWGSATGSGGFDYDLRVVSDPKPGDIVMYLDYNSGYYEAASHTALYIGNGRVIGANGVGTPGHYGYWGRVEETSVREQAYGRHVRYIRYGFFD